MTSKEFHESSRGKFRQATCGHTKDILGYRRLKKYATKELLQKKEQNERFHLDSIEMSEEK